MNQYCVPFFNQMRMKCGCNEPEFIFARAHVVPQPFIGMLPLDKALEVGTVFPNMYREFPSLFDVYCSKKKRGEDE